jgi:hypothetical protein
MLLWLESYLYVPFSVLLLELRTWGHTSMHGEYRKAVPHPI